MNWKKLILLSCVVPCVFVVSAATAQMRGNHAFMARPPMRRAPVLTPMTRMPMHRTPMLNSTSGFQRFRSSDFARNNQFSRVRRFNDGDFDRDDGFRRRRFNEIIIFDTFGFPFFPFYYPYPYYPYYPYGAYDSYGYSAGVSIVVQVQRRLASDGYYSGPIDGVMGRGTRRAIRAFERSHGLPVDGAIHRRLLTTMGLA